jgi:hypothetical protein
LELQDLVAIGKLASDNPFRLYSGQSFLPHPLLQAIGGGKDKESKQENAEAGKGLSAHGVDKPLSLRDSLAEKIGFNVD